MLVVFAAMSVWVLGLDVWQVAVHGRVWTGTDGTYVVDQMQYMAWVQDASRHGLASNLFVLTPRPSDYFQPGIALSAGFAALGVAPWLALLLWKPIAVLGGFFAVRAYARRAIASVSGRRAALVLALFFASFSVVYGSFAVVGDLMPDYLTWGYPFALVGVAAMTLALVTYERGRDSGRVVWAPGLLGALSSALHPWQGETLALLLIGVELAQWRGWPSLRRRIVPLGVTLVLIALPLLYYGILGHTDESWKLARNGSKHAFSLWTILLGVAPLLVPALFAYRRRPQNFIALSARVWPLAALVVYVLSATALSATPLHAFDGITIPLAVLAVEAVAQLDWGRVPRRGVLAVLVIAAVTIPATVWEMDNARSLAAPTDGNANFIKADERRALDAVARDPQPGGVLTRFYLGAYVPAKTGRRTFVGHCLWSQPDCGGRARAAQSLFDGTIAPAAARSFVRKTGAHFVVSDCDTTDDIAAILAPITRSAKRYGCASVFVIG